MGRGRRREPAARYVLGDLVERCDALIVQSQ